MKKNHVLLKILIILSISFSIATFGSGLGFTAQQSLAIAILSLSIFGTLFFWSFRLAFAFIGISILLISKTIDIETLVLSASLEVILFLTGMMVLIAVLKESGLFAWIVSLMIRTKNLNAKKFTITLSITSALLACAVDEVTSIIFMVAAVLEICDYFEVDPVPFIIMTIFATNIGSSGTVLGNPIGILIASKAGLTFEDFLFNAFPLMLVCLGTSIFIFFYLFRNEIKKLDEKIKEFGENEILIKLISVPPDKELKSGLYVFATTLIFIALHHRIETIFGLEPNTVLLVTPLIFSGLVMIWKREKARKYIENDVEWWSLLFFMLLFAQAGALKYTGATHLVANKMSAIANNAPGFLVGLILWISAIGSSILDNVVLVAAFIPVIQSFQIANLDAFWWALLFGGCLGGNITVIGSTANIVAIGILEKERNIKISFLKWFKFGMIVGVVTVVIAWGYLVLLTLR